MKIKIETYWNVNIFSATIASAAAAIKIETYWNVNTHDTEILEQLTQLK